MSADDMAIAYNDVLSTLVDKHAPRRSVRKYYRPITPWFNSSCSIQKRRVRCFERVYRRTKLLSDRNAWLSQLHSCHEFYKGTQEAYWSTLIANSSGNARKLWNSLSAVMGKRKTTPAQNGLSAEGFLDCYQGKVAEVRASTSGYGQPDYGSFGGECLHEFRPVDICDVRALIADAPTKTCRLDPAPTWLIKECGDLLAPYLTVLFNRSLLLGCFPRSFRSAEVTPVLKKSGSDASSPSNYRPVSNLQFISKILECVVNQQLLSHLQTSGLLPEHQSAYRRCHSTETALLKVTSDALLAMDQGMITLLGMLDLSSAFDCVDHHILLTRLERSCGIKSSALSWIHSYLQDRMQ